MNTSKTICTTCQKRVYKLEELRVDKHVLHKGCFVCYKCKGKLSLSTFAAVADKLYCKTHYFEMFSKSGGKYDAFNTPDAKSKVGEKVPRKEHEEVLKPQSKLTDDGRSEEKKRDTEKVMSVQDRLKQYKERGVASSKPPSAPEERGLKTLDKKKESKRESSGSDIGSEAKSETKANGTRTGEVERLSGELAQEKANSERLQAIVETLQLENSALKEKVSTLEAGLQEERAKIVAADEWCEKFKKELEMLDLPAAGQ